MGSSMRPPHASAASLCHAMLSYASGPSNELLRPPLSRTRCTKPARARSFPQQREPTRESKLYLPRSSAANHGATPTMYTFQVHGRNTQRLMMRRFIWTECTHATVLLQPTSARSDARILCCLTSSSCLRSRCIRVLAMKIIAGLRLHSSRERESIVLLCSTHKSSEAYWRGPHRSAMRHTSHSISRSR